MLTPGPIAMYGGAKETAGGYKVRRPFYLCAVRTGVRGFDLMIVRLPVARIETRIRYRGRAQSMDTVTASTVVPTIPTLTSPRLVLRAFTLGDVPRLENLLDTPEMGDTTLYLPYRYPPGGAADWIRSHALSATAGDEYTWAITRRDPGDVIGVIGLLTVHAHKRGDLGYWLGVPYWNQGYMTEAVRRVIAFAFDDLGFVRVEAGHVPNNPASGRVMHKAGMAYEGTLRAYYHKDGQSIDIAMRAIVRTKTV